MTVGRVMAPIKPKGAETPVCDRAEKGYMTRGPKPLAESWIKYNYEYLSTS